MRYRIEQLDTKWVITNARDWELCWSGSCWSEKHPITFTSEAAAEAYAVELFSRPQTEEVTK